MTPIQGISQIVSDYDGFLIDLWGVMHDGTKLYPRAVEAIAAIAAANKPIIFLSNAPRQAHKAQAGLDNFGIPREHYKTIITSGQVAHDTLASTAQYGKHYYYLGPSKDEDVLSDLDYTQAPLEQADFVLCAGFEEDFQPLDEIRPLLARIKSRGIPTLCINPDMEVVKQDGTHMHCAGWVCAELEKLRAEVIYFGKPHANVYYTAMREMGAENLLMIGDNLLTDIKGANVQGLDSLLITGGVIYSTLGHHPSADELASLCKKADAVPTYTSKLFSA